MPATDTAPDDKSIPRFFTNVNLTYKLVLPSFTAMSRLPSGARAKVVMFS